MSEAVEVITICVAGFGALSTLAVAIFGPAPKPPPEKPQ